MGYLTENSLNFAKEHIRKYYDSDFYPKPFEFVALWHNWDEVKEYLLSREVNSVPISTPRTFAAPKPNENFRIVHQLEPLEALTYTALAYLVAENIETSRAPVDAHIACSYRIQVANGDFFGAGNGYQNFLDKCQELASRYSYVLVTDITDFYNQIYLHRLSNNISVYGQDLEEIASDIEGFLTSLNTTVSKGVPVGPAASIIMAEASLIDIDQYLMDRDFGYTRYVDDIRIFGQSRTSLRVLLEKLTRYLYENHRLTLSSEKTSMLPSELFVREYLRSPQVQEKSEIHEALSRMQSDTNPYGWEMESTRREPDTETQARATVDALRNLMGRILRFPRLDLGLARHVLRKARSLRIRAIVPSLLDNLELFSPVINDVVLYLDKVTNNSFINNNMNRLAGICETSGCNAIPWVRFWLEAYLANHYHYQGSPIIRRFLFNDAHTVNQAMAAVKSRNVSWFRCRRSNINNYGSWDKRAIIYSSQLLSRDERNHWLSYLENNTDSFLDRMVIRWVRSL